MKVEERKDYKDLMVDLEDTFSPVKPSYKESRQSKAKPKGIAYLKAFTEVPKV